MEERRETGERKEGGREGGREEGGRKIGEREEGGREKERGGGRERGRKGGGREGGREKERRGGTSGIRAMGQLLEQVSTLSFTASQLINLDTAVPNLPTTKKPHMHVATPLM